VVVDIGPGLFTGLRVGVGAARGFGFALEVPVIGVTSLEVLAAAATATVAPGALVVPVVDARRGEVFWASYQMGEAGGMELVRGPQVGPPEVVAAELGADGELGSLGPGGPGQVLVLGDGGRRYGDVLTAPGARLAGSTLDHPPVGVLADLGAARVATSASGTVDADLSTAAGVLPLYLRDADARINWETRRPPAPAREPV
jgi:tRNA threonylcarbamoyladenosine biosynthesis protein TsaB